MLHLASTDEECELLEAISKVAGTGNAVKKAGHGDGGKYCKAHGKAHPPPDAATRTFWSVHRHYPYDVEPVTATSWTETCLWITVPDTEHCGGYTYAAKRNSKDTSYFDDEAAALECALELHRARLSSLASMMEYGVKACRIAEERLGRVGKDG